MTAKVDLYVAAASVGIYAAGNTAFGVRIGLPTGEPFSTISLPGTTEKAPVRAKLFPFHRIAAKHDGPEGLLFPVDISEFEEDIQPGDEKSTIFAALPPNAGPTMTLAPYVRGSVDADLTGIAEVDSDITASSIKVTFLK
jgi:hypothetical protein